MRRIGGGVAWQQMSILRAPEINRSTVLGQQIEIEVRIMLHSWDSDAHKAIRVPTVLGGFFHQQMRWLAACVGHLNSKDTATGDQVHENSFVDCLVRCPVKSGVAEDKIEGLCGQQQQEEQEVRGWEMLSVVITYSRHVVSHRIHVSNFEWDAMKKFSICQFTSGDHLFTGIHSEDLCLWISLRPRDKWKEKIKQEEEEPLPMRRWGFQAYRDRWLWKQNKEQGSLTHSQDPGFFSPHKEERRSKRESQRGDPGRGEVERRHGEDTKPDSKPSQ
jgi:hypothetical protein